VQYFPFGEIRVDNDYGTNLVMRHKYTAQELDYETSLYNYNARLYNPSLGRFISADTIVPNSRNPQALNRYSYVMNNPINYTDPSGHAYEWIGAGVGAVVGAYMAERQGGVWWKGAIVGAVAGYTGAWAGGAAYTWAGGREKFWDVGS
jgi:RHS repeat-associated protein